MDIQERIAQDYQARFGEAPHRWTRAPGRVNLIGEHTDYNDGFVFPVAIDRAIWIAIRRRTDRKVRVYSLDFDSEGCFSLDKLEHGPKSWLEYVKGVAFALQENGHKLEGWEGVMAGNVPVGAGLSSSAALEMAVARAFAVSSDLTWDPARMARAGQQAENAWLGLNTGIMDQMISAAGKAGHALLIDCRSLETMLAPMPRHAVVVIMDTMTRRGLINSAYNERFAECKAAARFFNVPALRDVTLAQFNSLGGGLDPVVRRRARHVISENERTLNALDAMRQDDAARLGRLMNASHASLRDDFEVCNKELNLIVALAQAQPGCLGARMTGAGFGGCAVALVSEEQAAQFSAAVSQGYAAATGLTPNLYLCTASEGAETWLV